MRATSVWTRSRTRRASNGGKATLPPSSADKVPKTSISWKAWKVCTSALTRRTW